MFGEAIELFVPTAAGLCAATIWLGLVLADWLLDRAERFVSSRISSKNVAELVA
jgi:hypothetical protein